MARVKIELPAQFLFATEIPILVGHINYGQHLDNAALIGLVSEARMRFLKSLGFSEGNIDGAGIIVADAAVQYRSEAFHGEVLVFELAVGDLTRVGCDLLYRVSEKTTHREVARGKTGIVFFDYTARKTVAIPSRFLSQITSVGFVPSAN